VKRVYLTACFAVIFVFDSLVWVDFQAKGEAPPPVAADGITRDINNLATEIKGLQSGNKAVTTAIKGLDTAIMPLRDSQDPDYFKLIVPYLTNYLNKLDTDKSKADAWANMNDLWAAINRVRDKSLTTAIPTLANTLAADLDKPMSEPDKTSIVKGVTPLGLALERFLSDRGRHIHIISARYGDIRNGGDKRVCDATAYFVSACEGKSSCPVASKATPITDTINGANVCGYEPEPIEPDSVNYAEVKYRCVSFDMRDISEAAAGKESGNDARTAKLYGKDKIVCL
jgi:hypothetical protein